LRQRSQAARVVLTIDPPSTRAAQSGSEISTIKEFTHGQERHSLDARRADFGADPPQHFRVPLSPDRTTNERSGAGFEEPQVSAALVSDYVAGRLDPLAARYIEAAAQRDPELSQAIENARAVRRRVKERLTGSRQ
jgi:hypothetical protein